jgi:prophage regulatory protein
MSKRVLRLRGVEDKTGLRHSAIYKKVAEGTFPKPFPLSAKARGWLEEDVDAWIDAQVALRAAKRAKAYKMMEDGTLPNVIIGGRRFTRETDSEALLKAGEAPS